MDLKNKEAGLNAQSHFLFFEVQLIYKVVLISAIQQSDSVIHVHSFHILFIMVYQKILDIVLCAVQ